MQDKKIISRGIPIDPLRIFCPLEKCPGKFFRVIYQIELLNREEAEYFNYPFSFCYIITLVT